MAFKPEFTLHCVRCKEYFRDLFPFIACGVVTAAFIMYLVIEYS